MPKGRTSSHREKQRVDQALVALRGALVEYLGALPRTSRRAYGSADLQALLKAFIDRFSEVLLPARAKNLALVAKDARNEVAHYIGEMAAHDALRHLANVRQLLKDLDATPAFTEVDGLYQQQIDSMRQSVQAPDADAVADSKTRAMIATSQPAVQRTKASNATLSGLRSHLHCIAGDEWRATFADVERILGDRLPSSARRDRHWWRNTRKNTQGKAWIEAGWRVRSIDMDPEEIVFVRARLGNASTLSDDGSATGLVAFDGDDTAYFDWLDRNPSGYVVNVRRKLSPDYVVLHRATCAHISAFREAGAYTERDFCKLCGGTLNDVADAPAYCGRPRGSFTKRCAHCRP